MTTMSNTDAFFDYYFKLKNDLPKIVVKKSNRKGKSDRTKNVKEPPMKKLSDYECSSEGKFICHFR